MAKRSIVSKQEVEENVYTDRLPDLGLILDNNSHDDLDLPFSPLFEQDNIIQQLFNSQDVRELLTNFKGLSQEQRDEVANLIATSRNESMSGLGDFSATTSQILKILMTPATESLPVLSNLTQELRPVMCSLDRNEVNAEPMVKRLRYEEEEPHAFLRLDTGSGVMQTSQENLYSTFSPTMPAQKQTYLLKPSMSITNSHQYNVSPMYTSSVTNTHPYNPDFMYPKTADDRRLMVFLIPQDKGRSRNYDYVGGTVTEDPNSEYSIFCRGRPVVVPFAVGLQNAWPAEFKLKVQVVFTKLANKTPVRCSNHKEGDNTIWRDQLMISTDPRAESLNYQDGHGFVISPVPVRCEILFLCRNSCRQGYEKEWQLHFSLVDQQNQTVSVRRMNLRVCEVPYRDIIKSKVKYEWNATASAPEDPVMKLLPCKEDAMMIEQSLHRIPSDVYPIYVSGYESYVEIMHHVSNMEIKKRHSNPVIVHAMGYMRDWTRETPILKFLQPVCGVETSLIVDKFYRKDVRTLGDLYSRFTPDFFTNMHISAPLASSLAALYLNWRNIVDHYDMSVARRDNTGI